MTDNDIIKAFDILDKFEFFGGQRAGRMLWFNKPTDIQDKDIGGFLRDLDFLKQFINRQKAENERLQKQLDTKCDRCIARDRAEAIKEFAERLKKKRETPVGTFYGKKVYNSENKDIDNLVKEMTEEDNDTVL